MLLHRDFGTNDRDLFWGETGCKQLGHRLVGLYLMKR
jgi:hypothetical protein